VIEYPRKVDSDKVLHVVVTGPAKSGKSHVAETICKTQKRALIKVNELIEWVVESASETGEKIKAFLDEKQK